MSVLVTGAGGIGSYTAQYLLEHGESVVLLDRNPARSAVEAVVDLSRVTLREGDVTDTALLDSLISELGIRKIVHTAALLSTAIRLSPADGIRVNIMGTVSVLEAARRHRLERIVLASSTTVGYPAFGGFGRPVFPEDFSMSVLSQRPTSIYAATKLSGEHLALLYRDLYGVSVAVMRYAAVIGPWKGPGTSVPGKMLQSLIGPARRGEVAIVDDPLLLWEGIEEFVDLRDCAHANVCAINAGSPETAVYNIASGQALTFQEVVNTVGEIFPGFSVTCTCEPSGGFAGFPHLRPARSDISRAAVELDFHPRFRLADSIRDLVKSDTAR